MPRNIKTGPPRPQQAVPSLNGGNTCREGRRALPDLGIRHFRHEILERVRSNLVLQSRLVERVGQISVSSCRDTS